MPEIIVEALEENERATLMRWLDSAAQENIDVTDLRTIEAAYERYVEFVLGQSEDEREDPTAFVAMVGFALGQWLQNHTVLEWRVITEDGERDLGLSLPDHSAVIFPSDRVADAWNAQERRWLAAWGEELERQLDGVA